MQILKDGPVFGIARACDMATSTDAPYFEIGAGLLDTAVGVLTFEFNGKVVVVVSNLLTIDQAAKTVNQIFGAKNSK